ncbi:MAG: carboxypeptidase regulatory-like domain-containing protein, partial [Deltaproteobacteria bacterium]|nr:carboxypeptidase regulatory-like domain-containing protein [Deltaproteobacteria bacterium]
ALKGGYEVIPGLSVGGLADFRFASGTGFFESSFDSTVISLAALGSYQLPSIPLAFHLNAGFVIDGTKNLLDTTATTYNRFSAQMSSFNRVLLRVGVEYATRYVGPFLEWSMEPFVGSGAPGVGDSPMRLTIGLHGWLGEHKGLQLMAGADIGLTGVGPRDANALGPDLYAFTIPRWNLVLRASYRFDPFHSDASKVIAPAIVPLDAGTPKAGPELASIGGTVIDSRTGKPVWNARVRVDSDVSWLAVDPQNGRFRSYKIPVGQRKVVVTAKGYHSQETQVTVNESGGTIEVKLAPSADIKPGTIRGSVKSLRGKALRKATILIPQLDKTIRPSKDGGFSVSLKPGEYKVIVSARGYRTQRKTFRVVEGETQIWNVELHR